MTIQSRLVKYAATAGAVSAAATASADIIYSSVDVTIGGTDVFEDYTLNLDGLSGSIYLAAGGFTDTFTGGGKSSSIYGNIDVGGAIIGAGKAGGNKVSIAVNKVTKMQGGLPTKTAAGYEAGDKIPGKAAPGAVAKLAKSIQSSSFTYTSGATVNAFSSEFGELAGGDRMYFGFAVDVGEPFGDSLTKFGWLDLSWDAELKELTIHGYAYNTDGTILAGEMPTSTPVPGAGGLLALAAGAAGLRRRRDRVA